MHIVVRSVSLCINLKNTEMERQTRTSIIVVNKKNGKWRYATEEEGETYKCDGYRSENEWIGRVTERPYAIKMYYDDRRETTEEIKMWAENEAIFMHTVYEMKKDVWSKINRYGKIRKIKKI